MIKIGDFEVKENAIIELVGFENKDFILDEIAKNNIIKVPRFFNVKKALKNNYDHEYIKSLNFDINKKVKNLNLKERYLLEFFLKIFSKDIILLDEQFSLFNDEIKEKLVEIMKKSNKTFIIDLNNISDSKFADHVYLVKNHRLIEYKEIESKYIKMTGEDINKALFPLKNMKIDHFNEREIEFVYNGNINELISYLSKIRIESLEIRNLNLDEIYKYYYKK